LTQRGVFPALKGQDRFGLFAAFINAGHKNQNIKK
jgi:hypothetical protein